MHEVELLLACTDHAMDTARLEHIHRLLPQVDAATLYHQANQHGLTSLLYRGLLQAGATDLAAPLADFGA
jgi:hypothetical protein